MPRTPAVDLIFGTDSTNKPEPTTPALPVPKTGRVKRSAVDEIFDGIDLPSAKPARPAAAIPSVFGVAPSPVKPVADYFPSAPKTEAPKPVAAPKPPTLPDMGDGFPGAAFKRANARMQDERDKVRAIATANANPSPSPGERARQSALTINNPERLADPTQAIRNAAQASGMPEADAQRFGREMYPGGPIAAGFPTSPINVPSADNPMLEAKRLELARTYGSTDKARELKGASIEEKNSYGTLGKFSDPRLDYNPVGIAMGVVGGAADELTRQVQRTAGKEETGLFGKAPLEAASVNVGRTIGGAPGAVGSLLAEKAVPVLNTIQREGIGAGISKAIGNDTDPIGTGWGTGDTRAKEQGILDSLAEGIKKVPEEIVGLAAMVPHTAQGIVNFGEAATRGDIPVTEKYRPIVDAATGMAQGLVRDTVKLVKDPRAKVEEGLLGTIATAAPLANMAKTAAGVVEAEKAAQAARGAEQAARVANVPGTSFTAPELSAEMDRLRGVQRGYAGDFFKAETDARKAAKRLELEDKGYTQTGKVDDLRIQAKARADEAATAKASADAAKVVLEQFEATHKPALDQAFKEIADAKRKANLLAGTAEGRAIGARLPYHIATLGTTAVADLLGVALKRTVFDLNAPGKGAERYFLQARDKRLPELSDIEREVGREANSRAIMAQEAYRAIPEKYRPTVRDALHMEKSPLEGSFYAPGNDYTEALITNLDGSGWDYTPRGRQWLDEQRATIADATNDLANATTPEAEAAARYRIATAEDAIQKAESHITVANTYAKPLAELSSAITADEVALGEVTPFDAQLHDQVRASNIQNAADAHVARKAKADAAYAKETAAAQKLLDLQQKETQLIADSVTRRAGQRNALDKNRAGSAYTEDWKKLSPTNQRGYKGAWNRLGERMGSAEAQNRLDLRAINAPVQTVSARQAARAQRIIDRAQKIRDAAVSASESQMLGEVEAIRAAPIPNGLRRVQWRQMYDKKAVAERLKETSSAATEQARSSRASLGPSRESKQLLGSKLRAERMSMTQREEMYGLSTKLGDEVNGLIKRADDVATLKLYKELAGKYGLTDEQWTQRRSVDIGVTNAERARRGLAPIDPVEARSIKTNWEKGYVRVPDVAKFPDLAKEGFESPKAYGELAGKWIPEDLWYEMANAKAIKEEMGGFMNRAVSLWKYGKTVLSPMTHARNFLSNALLFAPMAGNSLLDPRNWGFYKQALSDLVSPNKSPLWKEAQEDGLFSKGFAQNEAALKVLDDVHSGFADHVTGPMRGFLSGMYELAVGTGKALTPAERKAARIYKANLSRLRDVAKDPEAWLEERAKMQMPTATRQMREGLSKITDATRQAFLANPGAFYSVQDDWFRHALYMKLRANGTSRAEAAQRATKAYIDYANVPGFVQVLRAPVAPIINAKGDKAIGARSLFFVGGQPFLAFTARAIPLVADWATKDPWRAQIYANLHESISRANLATLGLDEQDQEAIRKSGRSYEQGQMLLGTMFPQWARDPESGELRAIDANFLAPTGGLTPQTNPYESKTQQALDYARSVFNFGPGPLLAPLIDVAQNRNSLTGRPITEAGQTTEEANAALGGYLLQQVAPPITPSPSDLWRSQVDINDPTRVKGGYQYEQLMTAAKGVPDYAGRERTLGEAALGVVTGSKLSRVNPRDRILDRVSDMTRLSDSAEQAATKAHSPYLRMTDDAMDDKTYVTIAGDYRERVRPFMRQLFDTAQGIARSEAKGDPTIRQLVVDLRELDKLTDPVDYYEEAKSILADYGQELAELNAERRAVKAGVAP